ncbi:DUF4625 domain-containing protein [Myroides sp. LJL119]
MKKYIFILLVSIFGFTSCLDASDHIDTQIPTIEIYSPTESTQVKAGEPIFVEMVLEDNQALSSYNIDIHSASDGHDHSGSDDHNHASVSNSITKISNSYTLETLSDHDHDHDHDHEDAFSFNRTWDDIFGKTSVLVKHAEIITPLHCEPGEYHFVVKVLDQAGNQAIGVTSFIIVEHD